MQLEVITPLIPVFILGAMSPGPSLAVVLRNSVSGGRRQGVETAVGHGLGYGVYAFFAALGFAAAIATSNEFVMALRILGIGVLLYLGFIYARSAVSEHSALDAHPVSTDRSGFLEGVFIAIFNPKILAWMLAIYSPFINADFSISTLIAIAFTGMLIDGGWYTTVALLLTTGGRAEKLRKMSRKIDGIMAVLMLAFVVLLVAELF
ncbi:MAG: LysE family translocator [SAR202 cluster bacterium]|nr:LysE family translocator [SAR202 cluster bacterium]|tara:strand:- start:450 stop:1067 length:618 start_codon:yes stop_codon:yes gene_type:complete